MTVTVAGIITTALVSIHLLIEDFCFCRGLLDKVGNPEQRSVKNNNKNSFTFV